MSGFGKRCTLLRDSQVALVAKNPPANAGDVRDMGSIPGLGRSSGKGHGDPLQCSRLENPMDRVWWATVHRGAQGRTGLKRLSTHTGTLLCLSVSLVVQCTGIMPSTLL